MVKNVDILKCFVVHTTQRDPVYCHRGAKKLEMFKFRKLNYRIYFSALKNDSN